MGQRGTCPLDFQQFHFFRFTWAPHKVCQSIGLLCLLRVSKYCVFCNNSFTVVYLFMYFVVFLCHSLNYSFRDAHVGSGCPTTKVPEQVNMKCPYRKTLFLQFSLPTPTISPLNPHLLNHSRWRHQANTLKTYCEQANRQNFHIWNSHRPHAARLFQTMQMQYKRLSQQQLGFPLIVNFDD